MFFFILQNANAYIAKRVEFHVFFLISQVKLRYSIKYGKPHFTVALTERFWQFLKNNKIATIKFTL